MIRFETVQNTTYEIDNMPIVYLSIHQDSTEKYMQFVSKVIKNPSKEFIDKLITYLKDIREQL